MQFHATAIAGAVLVTVEPHADERGLFARTFDAEQFAAAGLPTNWPHCNTSWNTKRGTLRGLHFQAAPRPDSKLVRCTRGRIFDVALDLRPDSPTFRQWIGVNLTADDRNALFIPAGCAHGFLTLENNCEIFYMMAESYVADLARGVRWNDPSFSIAWPFQPVAISNRDANWPDFFPRAPNTLARDNLNCN